MVPLSSASKSAKSCFILTEGRVTESTRIAHLVGTKQSVYKTKLKHMARNDVEGTLVRI